MTKPRRLVQTATMLVLLGIPLIASAQEPSRMPDKKVKPLLEQLEDSINKYHDAIKDRVKRTPLNTGNPDDNILQYTEDLKVASRRLKDQYNGRRSVSADVEEVLRRGSNIDKFMRSNPVVTGADNEWSAVKQNLTTLGQAFNVKWTGEMPDSRPHRMTDEETKALLDRIKAGTDQYRRDMEKETKKIDSQVRNNINKTIKDFGDETQRIKGRVGEDDAGAPQVKELLRSGMTIDRFMRDNPLSDKVRQDWQSIRNNLAELAKAYNVTQHELTS